MYCTILPEQHAHFVQLVSVQTASRLQLVLGVRPASVCIYCRSSSRSCLLRVMGLVRVARIKHFDLQRSAHRASMQQELHAQRCDYRISLRKLASLILCLRLFRIAFVKSCRASPASLFPATVPSPFGRSTLCSYSGTLGANDSGSSNCCLRKALAANRLCFFDFATHAVSFVSSFPSHFLAHVTHRIDLPRHPLQRSKPHRSAGSTLSKAMADIHCLPEQQDLACS